MAEIENSNGKEEAAISGIRLERQAKRILAAIRSQSISIKETKFQ